jgi:Skp family chaperone for outer membrane proteins
VRGEFRGFDILSRGRPAAAVLVSDGENLPELLIRGSGMFSAQVNPDSPAGTMQSIEHAIRALEKALADEQARLARAEKMLADFEEQLGKPFEHDARLKELVAKQAELNAALDLDKGEQQAAAPAEEESQGGSGDSRARAQEGTETKSERRPSYQRRQRDEEEPEGDDGLEIEDVTPVVQSRNDMRL